MKLNNKSSDDCDALILYILHALYALLVKRNRFVMSKASIRLPNVNDNLCCYIYRIYNYSFDHRGRMEFNFSKDNP